MQQLEDRRMLAVASQPAISLPTVEAPVATGVGTFDSDPYNDAVVLGSAGDLTVATGGPDDAWQTIGNTDPGLGPQHALVVERLTADPFSDVVMMSDDAVHVLHSDSAGGFTTAQTIAAPTAGAFDNSVSNNTLVVDFVDEDPILDLVAVASTGDSVLIYPGNVGGTFGSPTSYSTGVNSPTTAVVADVIGDDLPDLVVGHADGSLAFFEGVSSGSVHTLQRRDDLSLSESAAVVDLGVADFDGDGNDDVVVTTNSDAFVLFSEDDPRSESLIINGDFSAALTGWETEIVGHAADATPGRVNALGGAAQLTENESFLTSLKQTIVIPPDAQTLTFDLVALGLDPIAGGIPDAFEVSLLDDSEQSLVSTHQPNSTAFFNISSGSGASLASGVSVSGSTVTLDVSSLAAGTAATLAFDLIGNPAKDGTSGNSSVATIDNVTITPDLILSDSLNRVVLAGAFGGLVALSTGDVDGDGNQDVVVVDGSNDSLTVFNGDGSRGFAGDVISLAGSGSGASAIATGTLTANDLADDIVVTLSGSDLALSPLGADVTSPIVSLIDPVENSSEPTFGGTITIEFNEPMRESGAGSVNNPGAYQLIGAGEDGVFGSTDDVIIPITGVAYDPATLTAVLTVDAVALPLADDDYRIVIDGTDPADAIRDLVGNTVGGGADVTFDFTVDAPLNLTGLVNQNAPEGTSVNISADFDDPGRVGNYSASIDWGDGVTETATVTADASGFAGSIAAEHVYADDGVYQVELTLTDDDGGTVSSGVMSVITNADPVLSGLNDVSTSENTATTFTDLFTITDPGFTFGTGVETFDATIDWGDGSTPTTISNIAGSAGPTGPTVASVTADHLYSMEGVYTVTVTVSDDNGGATQGTLQAFVSNTAPVLAPIDDVSANEGESVTVAGSFTDDDLAAGVDPSATHTLSIDWGDGTVESLTPVMTAVNEAAFSGDHTYADDGVYEIRVTVMDDDNGQASQTADATITGVAPAITPASDATANVGASTTFALATFTDPGFTSSTAGTQETFTATVDWGDGSPVETITGVTVVNGSPGVLTTGSISADHVYAAAGVFTVAVTISDDDGESNSTTLNIEVNADDPTGACLPDIDFDRGLAGGMLPAGTIVTDQWSLWGVNVTTDDPVHHPAMIFNSSAPSGGDTDLGSPHQDFGGPGIGSGGASGAAGENSDSLGNVLIISEDGDSGNPDDNAAGGTLIFTFDHPVQLDEIRLLDIDSNETTTITLFDVSGNTIDTVSVGGLGNNAAQSVSLDADNVARMDVDFPASGAVTDLVFCRDIDTVWLSGDESVAEGDVYNLLLLSPDVVVTSWQVNWGDGTSDTVVGDSPTGSHVYADGDDSHTITGWATDGTNVFPASPLEIDVANVIPALTILGDATVEARTEYTLDLSSLDPGDDTIEGWVIDWGDGTLQAVTGNPTSVTHTYDMEGTYAVIAHAFDEDYDGPEVGITTPIEISARGDEGVEEFDLLIDDVVVASYTTTTDYQTFTYDADGPIAADQIKIEFTNDHYDPGAGIDNNLQVDFISIDGVVYQTEDPSVFSTGTWKSEDGIQPGYRESEWLHAGGYFQFAGGPSGGTLSDNGVFDTSWISNTLDVVVTPSSSLWLPNVNFDVDPAGLPLNVGTRVTDQFDSLGFTVSTNDPNKPAMIFDSSHPTGGDQDLGTPNAQYGGPGQGSGGQSNDKPLGNVLIISEDNDANDPDDNYNGGVLIFDFDNPVMIDEVGILDIDSSGNHIDLFDSSGALISSTTITEVGNNGVGRVALDALGVSKMEIHFTGSGAVTDIEFCRDGAPIAPAPTRFFVTDRDDDAVYRYASSGDGVGDFDASAAYNPRGITTTGEGNPVWVVSEEGSPERVYVYDTDGETLLGDWTAKGLTEPQGIATDGTDIWIVDSSTDRVQRYAGAASRLSGQQYKADSFQLAYGNSDPRGITTDGSMIWVVDTDSDKVFAYQMDGTFVNWWNLDPDNSSPRGITINPSGGDGVWVVDGGDDAVYHYAQATLNHLGSQTAINVFDLAPGNDHPEGIADPTGNATLRAPVDDQIDVAGDVDDWLINFTAGQEIFIDFTQLSGGPLTSTLIAPDGSVVYTALGFSSVNLDRGPFIADQTGTYTYRLSGNATNTPDYAFTIWDVDPPETTADIDFNTPYSGDISTPGAVDFYKFDGNVGDEIYFDVQAFSGGWIVTELTAPDGSSVFTNTSSSLLTADEGPLTLDQAGEYTLAWRGFQDDTPAYTFQINFVPPPEVTPIELDVEYNGAIESTLAEDHWTFEGVPGEVLYFDMLAKSGGSLTAALIAPDGSTVFSETNFGLQPLEFGRYTVDQAGTYSLQFSEPGGGTPDYSFKVWDVYPDSLQPGVLDQPVEGLLETPGTIDEFEYQLDDGDVLFLDMQRFFDLLPLGNQSLVSQWVSPAGSVLTSVASSSVSIHDRRLEASEGSGAYRLRVLGNGDDMGQFQFKVHDVTEVVTQTIGTDEVFNGAIEKSGQIKRFEFDAAAGQSLTLHALLNETTRFGYDSVALTIRRPDGSVLTDEILGGETINFDVNGIHTIDAESYALRNGLDGLGRFAFVLSSSVDPPIITTANLAVTSLSVDPVVVGSPADVIVSWTVTNVGTEPVSLPGGWVDRVYFSADREFDEGGLTRRAVADVVQSQTLSVGDSYSASASVTLPADFEGGFWTYLRTNAANVVLEGDVIDDNTLRSEGITNVYAEPRSLGAGPTLDLSPADQSRFPAATTLALTGSANSDNQSVNAFFVLDASGSTLGSPGLDANGDGVSDVLDDTNGNGNVGDILDTEIASVLRLTQQLTTTSDDVRVASIIFANSAELVDAGPADLGQFSADPIVDTTFRDGPSDFETAMRSIDADRVTWFRPAVVAGGTQFGPPIAELQNALAAAGPADRTLVYFLTDGAGSNIGIDYSPFEGTGTEFYSFQIGSPDLTPQLQELTDNIDAIPGVFASATAVTDPNDLTSGLLDTVQIQSVTLNGNPVTAIDPLGNFFAPVTIAEGANVFDAVVTTTSGRVSTAQVTLYGDAPGSTLDLSSLLPASDGLAATFAGTTYNRATNQLHASIAVNNGTLDSVRPPVTAVLENFSGAAIDILAPLAPSLPGGEASGVRGLVTFDTELGGTLAVGATSDSIDMTFDNPLRDRFDFDVRFLTAANSAPLFTDIPILSATIDTAYVAPVTTFDADGDSVTVELLEAPVAMTLSGGVLTWTPTAADAGHHRVVLEADDGRGGLATRQFTLLVDSGLPNGAPLITSDPPRFATVDEQLTYNIAAIDPELAPITLALESPPAGVSLEANRLTWTPQAGQLGPSTITILATDPQGAVGRQTFRVDVRPINEAPVFQTDPVLTSSFGADYVYASLATDTFDRVSYTIAGPTGITIGETSGVVTWPAAAVVLGDYPTTITATDDRGLSTTQPYTLTVTSDMTPPNVSILFSDNRVELGSSIDIRVVATDDVAVSTLALTVDGVAIPLDSEGRTTLTPTVSGVPQLLASATDTSGNIGTDTASIFVIDPADTTPPLIEIASPAPEGVVTYLTDVIGSVTDDNLEYYELQVSVKDAEEFRTVAREVFRPGPGGNGVVDDVLGVFDPTMLANDFYDIRIVAQDTNGNISRLTSPISVEGGAKLGNFRIELTDLAIPLAGIPIQINRIYDTLDAPYNGDFGYGWKLDVATPRIRESVRISEAEAAGAGMFGANPFRTGTRVYINAPDGRRVGFTFDPIPEATILGTSFRPNFTPDPGVYHTLEVPDTLLRQFPDGTFGLFFGNFNYNPSEYTLVTKDQLRYTYDQFADIQLQSIEDRNNVTLTFDENGIHSSTGPSITWTRNDQGQITEILDTAGNPLTYTYTSSGDLESFEDQVGNVTSMTYLDAPAHYLESITDPRGIQVLSLAYDENGRLTGQGDALGNSTAQSYDLANNTEVIADRLGNETTLVFDDRGNITEERDPLGFSTFYQYDANDNEIAITNKRGFTTNYEYDSRGNVTKITDALGGEMLMTFNFENDMTSMTDELGRLAQYVFDAAGNQVEMIDAAGNAMLQTFDDEGRVVTRTDGRGNTTTFEYGSGCACPNSPSKIIHPDGAEQSFTHNQFGQVTSSTDEFGKTTTTTYDDVGRPTVVEGPDGQQTTTTYDGNLVDSEARKLGATEMQVTSFTYDSSGELETILDANGGITRFTYDANQRLLTVEDPENNTTTYEYDTVNQVVSRIDTFGNETTYLYDGQGNLTQSTDRLGRVKSLTYDELNRVTEELWLTPDSMTANTIASTYDAVDNLLSVTDGNSAYTYQYDDLNRVIGVDNTGTANVPAVVLTYEYDDVGNVTAVFDNSGVRVDSEFSDRNDLLSKRWTGPGVDEAFVEFDYNVTGDRVATRRYSDPAGTNPIGRTDLSYDDTGRLTGITHLDAVDSIISEFTYEYDFAGRVTRQAGNGDTADFTYDLLGQLVAADRTTLPDESYAYDQNGNRTSSHIHGTDYQTGLDNRVLTDGLFNYTYDSEGNLILRTDIASGSTRTFTYDHDNSLVQIVDATSGGAVLSDVTFTYDAFGRRISQVVDGDAMYVVYDRQHAWADFDVSQTAIARYLFGDSVDEVIARNRVSETTSWYHTDALGSVVQISDDTGAVMASRSFDSYGQVATVSGVSVFDRFAFTGRELDKSVQLYFQRARTYDSAIGSFLQLDPIGFTSNDTNLYRYAFNSPTVFIDPLGEASLLERVKVQFAKAKERVVAIARLGVCAAGVYFAVVPPLTDGQIASYFIRRAAAQRAAATCPVKPPPMTQGP